MDLREMVQSALYDVRVTVEPWEDDEDIICLNGEPVGCTIPRRGRHDPGRWWPAAIPWLAEFITEHMQQK